MDRAKTFSNALMTGFVTGLGAPFMLMAAPSLQHVQRVSPVEIPKKPAVHDALANDGAKVMSDFLAISRK